MQGGQLENPHEVGVSQGMEEVAAITIVKEQVHEMKRKKCDQQKRKWKKLKKTKNIVIEIVESEAK